MDKPTIHCDMKGIIVAPPTGFTHDDKITFDPLIRHINACIEEGVNGFWINGCTALALYLSDSERKEITEVAAKQIAGRAPMWVHVGAFGTGQSCRLAEHARENGAMGISSLPPLIYGTTIDQVVSHLTTIQKAADLPITYYHVPTVSRVHLDANQLVELCLRVPNLVSIKFSDADLFKALLVRNRLPHVKIMTGVEEVLVAGLALGCFDGTVGAGQNFAPGPLIDAYKAYQAGNLVRAREIQGQLARIFEIQTRFGFTQATCAFLKLCGFDYGPLRPPMKALSCEDFTRFREQVLQVLRPAPFEEQRLIRSEDLLNTHC